MLVLALRSYQEDGHPREADVVEGDGPVEGIHLAGLAVGVVLVPVDALAGVPQPRLDGAEAVDAVLGEGGQVGALVHARGVGRGADVLLLAVDLLVEVRGHLVPGTERKKGAMI